MARDLAGLTTNATPLAVLRSRSMPSSPTPAQLSDRFYADRWLATPHLPRGAPTSPALANLACFGLDRRLAGLARAFDAQVTRYVYDIKFSGGFWLRSGVRDLLGLLREIIRDEGFALAREKTRVTTQSGRQQVLGLVVNSRRGLSRDSLDLLEATLTNCVRTGPATQNRGGDPDLRAHLLGRLAWVSAAAPHKVERLRAIFDAIAWSGRTCCRGEPASCCSEALITALSRFARAATRCAERGRGWYGCRRGEGPSGWSP